MTRRLEAVNLGNGRGRRNEVDGDVNIIINSEFFRTEFDYG